MTSELRKSLDIALRLKNITTLEIFITRLTVATTKQNVDTEISMASRAAWLHYAGGLTQSEVAKRLGLSGVKAHRLIMRANQEGMIKFFIDGEVTECVELEDTLSKQFNLTHCEVVPDFDLDNLPLRALGIAGAQFLKRELDAKAHPLIGVGHGRTLAACIDCLPATIATGTDFVSLLGGFSRKFSANPYDVIHRLAERTNAQAFVMPVPFLANSAKDRDVLLGQPGVSEVFALARRSTLKFVGIGSTAPEASLIATGMIQAPEIENVVRAGGAGEMLGHFFDDSGEAVETTLSNRTMTMSLAALNDSKIVAIAGGITKTRAIRSVLKSRILRGLITDERTARALVS